VEAQEVEAAPGVFYRAVGGVDSVIPVNTSHDLMVTEPQQLAEVLVELCRARAR
jgi:hypothetical protein